MNMQFYIKTEQLFPNDFLYGVITIVDKQPFDYMVGRMAGNREEIVETITKNVLKKNESNLKTFNYYSFKYETPLNNKMARYKLLIKNFQKTR